MEGLLFIVFLLFNHLTWRRPGRDDDGCREGLIHIFEGVRLPPLLANPVFRTCNRSSVTHSVRSGGRLLCWEGDGRVDGARRSKQRARRCVRSGIDHLLSNGRTTTP